MSLTDLLIMLAAAVAIVPVAQYCKLGSVPGFLLAGIVIGPSSAGLIDNVHEIQKISEFGVVFLLFIIGMELNPERVFRMRKLVFGLGFAQVYVTGAILTGLIYGLLQLPLMTAVLVGATLALSSTAFVMQLLAEKNALFSPYGQASIAVLLLQDLAVVPLLALVSMLSMPQLNIGYDLLYAIGQSTVLLVVVVILGRVLLQPLLDIIARTQNAEIFTTSALLLVIGVAVITEHLGLSMAMGAFLAGLLIADCTYRHQIMAEIHPFRGVLLGMFFMSMGMSLNIQSFFNAPLLALGLTLVLISIKILSLWPLNRLYGLTKNQAFASALLLGQSGEFALIIFAVALRESLITEILYQQLLMLVLLSMLITPALATMAHYFSRKEDIPDDEIQVLPEEPPIILAGFGRIGSRIGKMLDRLGTPYIAIDKKFDVIKPAREQGKKVFYGDARKPELFKSLGISKNSIIIVTLDDFEATEKVVTILRQLSQHAYILARGHNMHQCQKLLDLGASRVISENLEASIQLAKLALEGAGVEEESFEEALDDYKREYYDRVHRKLGD